MKTKGAVYSWRVTPTLKARLHEAARLSGRSVAELLDDIVSDRLAADERDAAPDAQRQRVLHASAARFAGQLSGKDPHRSTKAKSTVRSRLRTRMRRAH